MKLKKLVVLRRLLQTVFLALFVYILWSTTYPLKGYFSPEIIFKLDPLAVFFVSLAERVLLAGICLSGVMVVLTLIFGRFFCGWVCPMGTLIDWAGALGGNKNRLRSDTNQKIRQVKYYILAAVAIFAFFGIQTAWIFDPLVIAARFVSLNFIPAFTWVLNGCFGALIRGFHLYDSSFYDFYRGLKSSFLGIEVRFFSNTGPIFAVFLTIAGAACFNSRLWCRMCCPLGAIYAMTASPAFLERQNEGCVSCNACRNQCRMGAIRSDASYHKRECILCMDCVYSCPKKVTKFSWRKAVARSASPSTGFGKAMDRKDFLGLFLSSASVFILSGWRFRHDKGLFHPKRPVIRPPGALAEDRFTAGCIRCGNCMKVCLTGGLQPVFLESGLEGIWTPQLLPEIGYCEYNCTLCGNVCPTGVIPKLPVSVKQKAKLGTAHIDRSVCLPWSKNQECIVCEEHCPVGEKAIKLQTIVVAGAKLSRPVVDEASCIGCGLCQNVCPTSPRRAIRVYPS